MKHGPRCPSGPRYHKAEVWFSDAEVAQVRAHRDIWGGLSDAACIREAALLGYAVQQLRDAEIEDRLARLNSNPPVISPGRTA